MRRIGTSGPIEEGGRLCAAIEAQSAPTSNAKESFGEWAIGRECAARDDEAESRVHDEEREDGKRYLHDGDEEGGDQVLNIINSRSTGRIVKKVRVAVAWRGLRERASERDEKEHKAKASCEDRSVDCPLHTAIMRYMPKLKALEVGIAAKAAVERIDV